MTKTEERFYWTVKTIIMLAMIYGISTGYSIGGNSLPINSFLIITIVIGFWGSHLVIQPRRFPLYNVNNIEDLKPRWWYSYASMMARDIPFLVGVSFFYTIGLTWSGLEESNPGRDHTGEIIALGFSLLAVFLTIYQVISQNTRKELDRKYQEFEIAIKKEKEKKLSEEKDAIKNLIAKQNELISEFNRTLSTQNRTIERLRIEINEQKKKIDKMGRSNNKSLPFSKSYKWFNRK